MKITIFSNPPAGYRPTPEIKIFSPLDDPNVCVMAQLHRESELIVNGNSVWVAVPTERVEKIKFVNNPVKTNEQIQNQHPGARRHD
jgi:hypothetical protein